MKKIIFALALVLSKSAYTKEYNVLFFKTMSVSLVDEHIVEFFKAMDKKGKINGRKIKYTKFNANGKKDKAHKFIKNYLKNNKPDLVITNATMASKIARSYLKETNIPQVFFSVIDPVEAGIIDKEDVGSNSNVAGVISETSIKKKLEVILKTLDSKYKNKKYNFGMVYSDYPSSVSYQKALRKQEQQDRKFKLTSKQVKYLGQGKDKIKLMKKNVMEKYKEINGDIDYIIEPFGPLGLNPEIKKSIRNPNNKPIILGSSSDAVRTGAIFHIHPPASAVGRMAADIVEDVLNGKDPGTIVNKRPEGIALFINLKRAIELKLPIPFDYLKIAGENIIK